MGPIVNCAEAKGEGRKKGSHWVDCDRYQLNLKCDLNHFHLYFFGFIWEYTPILVSKVRSHNCIQTHTHTRTHTMYTHTHAVRGWFERLLIGWTAFYSLFCFALFPFSYSQCSQLHSVMFTLSFECSIQAMRSIQSVYYVNTEQITSTSSSKGVRAVITRVNNGKG